MPGKKIISTHYGKHSKYEVVKDEGYFETKYYVLKNGKAHRGSFSSLGAAIKACEDEK